MSATETNRVSIPKWLHWLFIVLAMLLVYRLTVWSEDEVRDERYYQRSMGASDLVRVFAEKLIAGDDPVAVTNQYVAESVQSPVGNSREAVQKYFSAALSGAQLLNVGDQGDTAFLFYSVNGSTRIDVLTVRTGEIVAHVPYAQSVALD